MLCRPSIPKDFANFAGRILRSILFSKVLGSQSLHKKNKFSIKDLFSKCDQICSFLWIWSHSLKKSLVENFIFCVVNFMTKVGRYSCFPVNFTRFSRIVFSKNIETDIDSGTSNNRVLWIQNFFIKSATKK